jgi:hypothetical protein
MKRGRHTVFRSLCCWSLVFVTCAIAGCGPASGIQPGIPPDANNAPVNPTPDMGPSPASAPADAAKK